VISRSPPRPPQPRLDRPEAVSAAQLTAAFNKGAVNQVHVHAFRKPADLKARSPGVEAALWPQDLRIPRSRRRSRGVYRRREEPPTTGSEMRLIAATQRDLERHSAFGGVTSSHEAVTQRRRPRYSLLSLKLSPKRASMPGAMRTRVGARRVSGKNRLRG